MEDETEKILREQLKKIPSEVCDFILSGKWDTDTDEIGSLYNLPEEKLASLKQEITLVLAGLTHPDEFKEVIEQETELHGAVLDAIVASVESKIFAPIRPALSAFFEKEVREIAKNELEKITLEEEKTQTPAQILPEPAKVWEKTPDVAPDNLPTAEGDESLLPPIPLKFGSQEEVPAHPFEEKMKKVFTAGQQSMGELTIEPPSPQPTTAPNAPRIYHADPYREVIE